MPSLPTATFSRQKRGCPNTIHAADDCGADLLPARSSPPEFLHRAHGHPDAHKATPTCRHVRKLRRGQPFFCHQPDRSTKLAARHNPSYAAPHIIAHTFSTLRSHQTRPHGIEVHVVHERTIVITRAALAQKWPCNDPRKAGPIARWRHFMPPGINALQPSHPCHQVTSGCFHHQMIMIAHQHPCVHPPACALTRLSKESGKIKPIGFIAENALTSVSPRHHVVKRPVIFDSNRSRHGSPQIYVGICRDLLTDPYSTPP